VALYDFNGDGVVDRFEYQSMVEDMAALREAQEKEEARRSEEAELSGASTKKNEGWVSAIGGYVSGFVSGFFGGKGGDAEESSTVVEAPRAAAEEESAVSVEVNGDYGKNPDPLLPIEDVDFNGEIQAINVEVVDDDDGDDDDEDDDDDDEDRRPKRPRRGGPRGDGDGDDGAGGGAGPSSDPGYGRPSDDDLDKLNRILGKS